MPPTHTSADVSLKAITVPTDSVSTLAGIVEHDPFARAIAQEQLERRQSQILTMINAWLRAKAMRLVRAAVVRSSARKRPDYVLPGQLPLYHVTQLVGGWSVKLLRVTDDSATEEPYGTSCDRLNLLIDGWLIQDQSVNGCEDVTSLEWRTEGAIWWQRAGQSITAPSMSQGGVWILQLVSPARYPSHRSPSHPEY